MITTIQVEQETADMLKTSFEGMTYDAAIRRLLAGFDSANAGTEILTFRKTILAAQSDEQDRRVGVKGIIIAAFMHFPPGTNGLVEVRIVLGGTDAIVPSQENTFIALDDETFPATGLSIPVSPGSIVRVEWFNYDGAFAHTVPVEVIVMKTG